MNHKACDMPVARLFFRGDTSGCHGWYVQHYVGDRLRTTRLELQQGAGRGDALTEAAGYIGCVPEQIQIDGVPWPSEQLPM